ncbi:response regulator transcription factor [Paenibacillus sp. SC116]|uniref:response regulator transcription factor n=1 Tax=Paenibacillus sp. SC116 TaxID=2968986 RepID=UPI00215B6399|nr:response regulator transcription factor [Paenibacillus sp. SC116]MCR8845563.1 response regulator transcription factor [Paenibacillus sp. SC116]
MISPSQTCRVLIVDDEANMRNLLRIHLKRHGYLTEESHDGEEALAMLKEQSFDLVILDIMMPGIDGWEVVQRIRQTMSIPVIMLTARSDKKDMINGLSIGADDYLAKPFEPDELIARITALLRRSHFQLSAQEVHHKALHFPHLIIYEESREVVANGLHLELTPKEYDVLHLLATHPQRVYDRETMIEHLWGLDYDGDNRSVDTHVKNVRMKMEQAQLGYNPIQTVWGIGYRFNAKGTAYEK